MRFIILNNNESYFIKLIFIYISQETFITSIKKNYYEAFSGKRTTKN